MHSLFFSFVKELFLFIWFLLKLVRHNNWFCRIEFEKQDKGTVAVLANGPTLKDILPKIQIADEFKGVEFIVLNYFAFDKHFSIIRPKHYCLADPMFFINSLRIDEAKKLFNMLQNTVDWKMNLYIPASRKKIFRSFSGITNPQINIIPVNTTFYEGIKKNKYFLYKQGLAMPKVQSVAHMAIFIAINYGFKNINLYGVEHSGLDSICVNDKNQLCYKEKHFYDQKGVELKPVYYYTLDKGTETVKISSFMEGLAITFKSHDLLADYAKYLGVKIRNLSHNSLVDSYDRA